MREDERRERHLDVALPRRCRSFRTTTAFPITVPRIAPARTSEVQWAFCSIRARPTVPAIPYATIFTQRCESWAAMTDATANACVVWPDGKDWLVVEKGVK